MKRMYLKRYNALFITLRIFEICFGWLIPIFIFASISVIYDIQLPTVVNVVLVVLYLGLLLACMILEPKLIGNHIKKQVDKLKEKGFHTTYSMEYSDEYVVVDEVNGKIAAITKQNPFKIQIVDAALVDDVTPFVSKYRGTLSSQMGLKIWISGKKFLAYTFNGVGFRYINAIDINSAEGQSANDVAQQLAIHIGKAKEIAINKNRDRVKS